MGADVVVAEELEGTLDLVGEVLRVCGVAEGSVVRFARELREEGYQALRAPAALAIDPWLAELLRESPSEWLDLPYGFSAASLADLQVRARTGATILAVEREGIPTPGPQPDFVLQRHAVGVDLANQHLVIPNHIFQRERDLLLGFEFDDLG